MKINKEILKEAILETLGESGTVSAQDITKRNRSADTAQQVSALTPRERKILGQLQQVQKAMSEKGEQATAQVVRLVQMMVGELQKGGQ